MTETPPSRPPLLRRAVFQRLASLLVVVILLLVGAYQTMIRMPGRSYRGPLDPLSGDQTALRDALKRDVEALAGAIGGRSAYDAPAGLAAAADFLKAALTGVGFAVGVGPTRLDAPAGAATDRTTAAARAREMGRRIRTS